MPASLVLPLLSFLLTAALLWGGRGEGQEEEEEEEECVRTYKVHGVSCVVASNTYYLLLCTSYICEQMVPPSPLPSFFPPSFFPKAAFKHSVSECVCRISRQYSRRRRRRRRPCLHCSERPRLWRLFGAIPRTAAVDLERGREEEDEEKEEGDERANME